MSTKRREESDVRWLDADEERAWRAFRQMAIGVQSRVAKDLAAEGLSEPDYEVLSTLSERVGHRSPLHEQAVKMAWSRSRLSRHTSRMEARGLITREDDPADGRGCMLVLTADGLDALRRVAPSHLQSVRRHFVDRLDREDLAALTRIAEILQSESSPSASGLGPARSSLRSSGAQ